MIAYFDFVSCFIYYTLSQSRSNCSASLIGISFSHHSKRDNPLSFVILYGKESFITLVRTYSSFRYRGQIALFNLFLRKASFLKASVSTKNFLYYFDHCFVCGRLTAFILVAWFDNKSFCLSCLVFIKCINYFDLVH
jgi:hypothetical protein